MAHKSKRIADQRRRDIQIVNAMKESAPQELKDFFVRMTNEACDIAEKHNLHPREMAVMAASLVGLFAMTEVQGNVHADAEFDDYLAFADAAMSLAVASARIAAGWRPEGMQ